MKQGVAGNHRVDIKKTKTQFEIRVDKNNKIVFRSQKIPVIRCLDKNTKSTENRNKHWGQ